MGSAGVSRRCNRLRSAGAVLTVSALAFMTQMTSTASTNALEGIVQDDVRGRERRARRSRPCSYAKFFLNHPVHRFHASAAASAL